MVNYLKCTNMYFGNKGIRCIVYQVGNPNITVYYRKFNHNFLEIIDEDSKEAVDCQNISKHNSFIVSDDDGLEVFCGGCFQKKYEMTLPLKHKSKDEQMEILSIKVSRD